MKTLMLVLLFVAGCRPELTGPNLRQQDVEQTGSIRVVVCPDTLKVPEQSLACYEAWRKLAREAK